MEDDDEFGDLYTDVLRPLTASFHSQPQATQEQAGERETYNKDTLATSFDNRQVDLNLTEHSDEVPQSAHDSIPDKSIVNLVESDDVRESDPGARVLGKDGDVKLQEGEFHASSLHDESNIDALVEERDEEDPGSAKRDEDSVVKSEKVDNFVRGSENNENLVGEDGGQDPFIPGISGGVGKGEDTNFGGEWDSDDSDDDLKIVLNAESFEPMGIETVGGAIGEEDDEDDEDGENLVILADNDVPSHQPVMEEQDWGEEAGAGADGERKELGDAAKAGGGASVAQKIGYSVHPYQHSSHSPFKYVRPVAGPEGTPSQVRPPVNGALNAGRGRGDWRPAGVKVAPPMQKGFHPNYGMPAWGNNGSGRGSRIGLEFTLPSYKTIFEVDIDGFEEKPWRLPGIDLSDFFNFGLNEETWKLYCKQLEQLRLESSMQGKIRVYESGRMEQDNDPDLPPELAAAAGIRDVSYEQSNHRKLDAEQNDLAASARFRPQLPSGRPIPVETGTGDRLPSIDTRPQRIRDSDAIIEIVCQDPVDDNIHPENDMSDQSDEKSRSNKDLGDDRIKDPPPEDFVHYDDVPQPYKSGRGAQQIKSINGDTFEVDLTLLSPSESPKKSAHPGRNRGGLHEERESKGKAPQVTSDISSDEPGIDNANEESAESIDNKRSPLSSSPNTDRGVVEEAVRRDNGSHGEERKSSSVRIRKEGNSDDTQYIARRKPTSHHEHQLSQGDRGEDMKTARSSDENKARPGSSKDFRNLSDGIEDIVPDGRSARPDNIRRPVVGDEDSVRRKGFDERQGTDQARMVEKGRRDSYSHKGWDSNAVDHLRMKTESIDSRVDSSKFEGGRQHSDQNLQRRRTKVEDTRKREQGDEPGSGIRSKIRETERNEQDEHNHLKRIDNGSWRSGHAKELESRHRDSDSSLKSRNESLHDRHGKRRKEDVPFRREYVEKEEIMDVHRESTSRRKRERDDIPDQRRKDEVARLRDVDQRNIRQKEEAVLLRERAERQREREEWQRPKPPRDEVLSRREREEARGGMRSGRASEDRTWVSHSRGKDEYRGSDREYSAKETGRPSEQLKGRDRSDNESLRHYKSREDIYPRGIQLSSDERKPRTERSANREERSAYASESSRVHQRNHKDISRKEKDSDSGHHHSSTSLKSNQDENRGQTSDMLSLKGRIERGSGEKEVHMNRQSTKKHREDASSDEDQPGSKRGRSKLERWTSHKERDFSVNNKSSSSLKIKEINMQDIDAGASLVNNRPDEPAKGREDNQQPVANEANTNVLEVNNVDAKPAEDKHLETVEKLKKRSERFKLPMPSEKEAIAIKKMESEPLPSAQSEVNPDLEIKAERPARRRRWTSS